MNDTSWLKEELKNIKRNLDEPYLEVESVSIIENNAGSKEKPVKQYRVSIPKKFANIIDLSKDTFVATVSLTKEKDGLNIKLRKK